MEVIAHVRNYGGTYIAKVMAAPFQCSCTSGEGPAARALARKYYGPKATVERSKENDRAGRAGYIIRHP